MVDGPGNPPATLKIAADTVVALLREQVPTLVYCGAGMSRSPAVVAAAIAGWRGDSLEETLKTISDVAPHDISPAFWSDLKRSVEQAAT